MAVTALKALVRMRTAAQSTLLVSSAWLWETRRHILAQYFVTPSLWSPSGSELSCQSGKLRFVDNSPGMRPVRCAVVASS